MIKIAIAGKIRSGKDEVAKIFSKNGYREYKFSQGIGNVIDLLFNPEKRYGKPRKMYQDVGQKMREINPNVWINFTLHEIAVAKKFHQSFYNLQSSPEGFKVVISDLRQKNEVEALRKEGYVILKVEASKDIRLERIFREGDYFNLEDLEHDTEQYVDHIVPDFLIVNEGTLSQLSKDVMAILYMIETNYNREEI